MKILSLLRTVGLLSGLFLAFISPAAAQAPAWQTARAVAAATAASSASIVSATAVDAWGNVYLAGNFTGSVVLGNTTLTSLGEDIFVAKFNPISNQFVWAQRAGGTDNEAVYSLAVSGTSVYVAGNFVSSTASFGTITLTNISVAGSADVFVAKLTDSGAVASFTWAQRAGGTGQDDAKALAVSGTSVYVAGNFISPTVIFGNTTLTNTGGAASNDVFVAKLTDAGNSGSFVWAKGAGSPRSDDVTALTVSGTSVYLAGGFGRPSIVFGTTTLSNVSNGFNSDVFVTKLTDAGTSASFVWAQRAGGTDNDIARALAVRGSSVYVAGEFLGSTAIFGQTVLTNSGRYDVFVTKLTDVGTSASFTWAERAGGTGIDIANALEVSGTSVYVAGYFDGATAIFGASSITNTGAYNVFVAKLVDAGNTGTFAWAQQAGGTASDIANALSVSGTSVYVAGGFSSPIAAFSPITITTNSPSLGFLASLTDLTLAAVPAAPPREPVSLFPNPARATATLRRPAGAGAAALVLADALGRIVRRYPAPAGPTDTALDLGGLPAGLYLLRGAGPALRLTVE